MQLNRMERAILCLLRDHPDQLFGPQSFVDKLIEEGVPKRVADLRRVERALKKLHRIGFISTMTRQ